MSSHPQPSPPGGMHPHHATIAAHPQVNGHHAIAAQPQKGVPPTIPQKIAQLNESVWLQIGSLSELMGDLDGAMHSFEQALRHNQWSIPAMTSISFILRSREQFQKAIEYLQAILKLDPQSGESWGSLGHCHLMLDNLQEAYSAYQQALYHLRDPKEPKLWYGIGILYDRYGSLDHAEEAFTQVMHMQPDFEKANEIYFRLGIIYKQQQKFNQSLDCFKYIVNDPPRPLTEEDIWFQIGHVHEQQKDFESAKSAYRRVLERDSNHAKVLQQLGWLYHQQSNSYSSQEQAIEYLEKSVNADSNDAQSWYLLGRCYMSQAKYPKAYEAYQQAVYRDGKNPTFWCSIGVLYYQINQYRDALDAYSRAIRLNPYISEVWYDLGTLYESCNNQTADALDAYSRAADLDPSNVHIKARLQLLQSGQAGNSGQAAAPVPQDVHPQAYQAAGVGAPPGPQWGAPAPSGPPSQGPAPQGRIGEWGREGPTASGGEVQGIHGLGQQQKQPNGQYEQRENILPQLGPSQYGANNGNGHRGAEGRANGSSMNGQGSGSYGGGRPFTPPVEIRPIREERPQSPGSNYAPSHPQYHHGGPATTAQNNNNANKPSGENGSGGGLARESVMMGNEHGLRERGEERPPSSMKRGRERDWENSAEQQGPAKKIANEETRSRLEEPQHQQQQPTPRHMSPNRMGSPSEPVQLHRREPSEGRREEQQRRGPHEGYHSSEGGHHPPTLPPIQHMQQQPPPPPPPQQRSPTQQGLSQQSQAATPKTESQGQTLPPLNPSTTSGRSSLPPVTQSQSSTAAAPAAGESTVAKEEERDDNDNSNNKNNGNNDEPPARKMDVDEDYDNEDEGGAMGNADDIASSSGRKGGPTSTKNGSPAGSSGAVSSVNGSSHHAAAATQPAKSP